MATLDHDTNVTPLKYIIKNMKQQYNTSIYVIYLSWSIGQLVELFMRITTYNFCAMKTNNYVLRTNNIGDVW